jgi:peptide/nickel transport system permease protein
MLRSIRASDSGEMMGTITNPTMASKAASQIASLSLEEREKQQVGKSLFQLALMRLRRDYLTLLAGVVLIILTALSISAPAITGALGVNAETTNLNETFLPPGTPGHILGTDDLGRDYLARLLYGGQVSLSIAFFGALLSLAIGLTIGVYTGFFGGIVDDIVNWVIITLGSIPSLLLLIIIVAVFKPSPLLLVLIFGFLGWTGTARLVRGETLALRAREYVIGATAVGARPLRIMFIHIVPNLLSIVIISLVQDIGGLILAEAGLSYLGFGIKPPTPSWGNMLTGAETLFTYGAYLVILPGALITLTVLCLYVIGDGLRDAFDPQLEKR